MLASTKPLGLAKSAPVIIFGEIFDSRDSRVEPQNSRISQKLRNLKMYL